MDETSKLILSSFGIEIDEKGAVIEDQLIPRETFLSDIKYNKIKKYIPDLKNVLSSSSLTSLHKEAENQQKYPPLNLVRQILNVYSYDMKPIRKCDGYTKTGTKKFRRFFLITKRIMFDLGYLSTSPPLSLEEQLSES